MHPTSVELLDFLDDRIESGQRDWIRQHLDGECRRCRVRLGWYWSLIGALRNGAMRDAPASMISQVVRLVPRSRPVRTVRPSPPRPLVARLVFDSYAQETATRGPDPTRRLRFEARDLELDIAMEMREGAVDVFAQLTEDGAEPVAHCQYRVVDHGDEIAHGDSDDAGEFQVSLPRESGVEIIVETPGGPVRFLLPR